jgi:hypothetical protein
MNSSTRTSDASSLDWQAFRYVADEMSRDEAADFESLLADDQAARDAVVRAVELSQNILAAQRLHIADDPAVALAERVSQSPRRRFAWQLTGLLVAAAACWGLVAAATAWRASPSPTVSTSMRQTAIAWSAWFDRTSEAADDADAEELPAADFDFTYPLESETAASDVPGWMVEALRGIQSAPGEGSKPRELNDQMEG